MSKSENNNISRAGQILRQAREAKGLSISDISTATKISKRALAALEADDLEKLPAKSFTRGFIRAYAQYLKLDPKPIIEAYDIEDPFIKNMGQTIEQTKKEVKSQPATAPSKRISKPDFNKIKRKPFWVAALITIIIVTLAIKAVVDKYSKEAILPTSAKTESGEIILDTETGEESPLNQDADAADIAAEDSKASTEENLEVAPAEPTPAPEPEPTLVPTIQPEPTAIPTPKPTEAPKQEEKKEQAPVAKSYDVILEALDKVEVEIEIEGEKDQDVDLEPGAIYQVKTSKKMTIEVSDGGLVNLIVNGKERGTAGDLGSKAKITIP